MSKLYNSVYGFIIEQLGIRKCTFETSKHIILVTACSFLLVQFNFNPISFETETVLSVKDIQIIMSMPGNYQPNP